MVANADGRTVTDEFVFDDLINTSSRQNHSYPPSLSNGLSLPTRVERLEGAIMWEVQCVHTVVHRGERTIVGKPVELGHIIRHHTIFKGKIPCQGPAEPVLLLFMDIAFGIVSPIAFEIVSTTLFSAKISTGLFLTTPLHVGHVYTSWGMLCEMRYCATSRSSCTRSSGLLRALADMSRRCRGSGWLIENSGNLFLCLASRV